jgi:hypothetical protein
MPSHLLQASLLLLAVVVSLQRILLHLLRGQTSNASSSGLIISMSVPASAV